MSGEVKECVVCCEPIKDTVLLPCNHSDTCLVCLLTMTSCYGVRRCQVCQEEATEDPIILNTKDPISYELERMKSYKHDPENHVFYMDDEVHSQVLGFKKFHCSKCTEVFNTFNQFSKHVSGAHRRKVCKVCHKAGRQLPSEVESYTSKEFAEHKKHHPTCLVCPFIAFDQAILADHMRENHFRCEVCASAGEVKWFADSDVLRVHFNECHFACDDPVCAEHGFIVFESPMELQLHRIMVHGDKTPVELSFQSERKPKDNDVEHKERMKEARKTLSAMVNSIWRNGEKVNQINSLIAQVQKQKLSPAQFLKNLNSICNKHTQYLFCAVVATIENPVIRASIVRERSGFRPCRVPSGSRPREVPPPEPAPVQVSTPAPVTAPAGPGKKRGRGKKVVLTSY